MRGREGGVERGREKKTHTHTQKRIVSEQGENKGDKEKKNEEGKKIDEAK